MFSLIYRIIFIPPSQVVLFFAATITYANYGKSIGFTNAIASDLQNDNTTLYGNQLHFSDYDLDLTGKNCSEFYIM